MRKYKFKNLLIKGLWNLYQSLDTFFIFPKPTGKIHEWKRYQK